MNRPRESRDTQPTAIGYVHSAIAGADGARNVEAGRHEIAAFVDQQGLRLVACEADMGRGRIARRAVLKALAHGWPKVLVLPALKHLTRNGRYAARVLHRLIERGQHIVTADGQLDTRTQPGQLMVELMRVCGEVERENAAPTLH